MEKNEVRDRIEELKQRLNALIAERESLLDPEIIEVSKRLDEILNEYNEGLTKKK